MAFDELEGEVSEQARDGVVAEADADHHPQLQISERRESRVTALEAQIDHATDQEVVEPIVIAPLRRLGQLERELEGSSVNFVLGQRKVCEIGDAPRPELLLEAPVLEGE